MIIGYSREQIIKELLDLKEYDNDISESKYNSQFLKNKKEKFIEDEESIESHNQENLYKKRQEYKEQRYNIKYSFRKKKILNNFSSLDNNLDSLSLDSNLDLLSSLDTNLNNSDLKYKKFFDTFENKNYIFQYYNISSPFKCFLKKINLYFSILEKYFIKLQRKN